MPHLLRAAIWMLAAPGLLLSINFNAPRAYSLGEYGGVSLVQGDFNGDGTPDLALTVAGYGLYPGAIEVFLGQAGGGFRHEANYTIPTGNFTSSGLLTLDFNHDGILDLAAAGDAGVSVLLGKGDGTFSPPVTYVAGSNSYSIATADFNGDGIPDLAVSNAGSGNVSVLLGNGDGTFLRAVNYAVGTTPQYLATGDFNGDGKPDLAVTNYNLNGEGTVSILFGIGDGTFQRAVNHPTGKEPQSIAVGDFNGDGKPDLAITLFEGTVSILLANGGGTFLPPVSVPAGPNPSAIVVQDLNRDGKLDLAVVNEYEYINDESAGGFSVSILHGNGDGTFQKAIPYWVAGAVSVVFADFNGDGRLDLACAGGSLSILLNNGKGGYQQPVLSAVGANPISIATGDFNGDGKPDLAVANIDSSNISVLIGKGDGSFMPQVTYDTGAATAWIVAGDFNGDGKLDLVVGNAGISILFGNGDGTFQAPLTIEANQIYSLAVADFNLDGKLDLATDSYVLLGNGDGTFQTPLEFDGYNEDYSVAVGDFNGDGKPDLAVVILTDGGYYSEELTQIMLGNGDGTFSYGQYTGGGLSPNLIGDFNGDGKLDITSGTWIEFGNGDGTFTAPVILSNLGSVLAVGDFNGDGKLDQATLGRGGISISLGNGDGTFQAQKQFVVGGCYSGAGAVADFNGDGKADLAVVDGCSNTVAILTNTTQ